MDGGAARANGAHSANGSPRSTAKPSGERSAAQVELARCEQIVHRWKLSVSKMRAQAIVRAVAHYADPKALLDASRATDTGMRGIAAAGLPAGEQLAPRGW